MLKDYDCTIDYHPGKANVVADALSRKAVERVAGMNEHHLNSLISLRALNVSLFVNDRMLLATMKVRPQLLEDVKQAQLNDSDLKKLQKKKQEEKPSELAEGDDCIWVVKNRVYVPNIAELK